MVYLFLSFVLVHSPNAWSLLLRCSLSEMSNECPRYSVWSVHCDCYGTPSGDHQCLHSALSDSIYSLLGLAESPCTCAPQPLAKNLSETPTWTSPPIILPCITPFPLVLCPANINDFSRFKLGSLPPSYTVIWKAPLGWTSGWTWCFTCVCPFFPSGYCIFYGWKWNSHY